MLQRCTLVSPWCVLQNASEFQTWKSRPQLIHMQYAMLNEASGASDASRLAKWQSIVVSPACPNARLSVAKRDTAPVMWAAAQSLAASAALRFSE